MTDYQLATTDLGLTACNATDFCGRNEVLARGFSVCTVVQEELGRNAAKKKSVLNGQFYIEGLIPGGVSSRIT